jgi:hypothetical protein
MPRSLAGSPSRDLNATDALWTRASVAEPQPVCAVAAPDGGDRLFSTKFDNLAFGEFQTEFASLAP